MMTGVEITPVYVTGDTRYEEFNPVEIPGVKDVLYGSNADITLKANGYETTANMDFWDDPKKVAYEIVVEGRLPENDNEIVITGGVQKDLHAEIGDIIYLVSNDKTREYMLVGIDQKINHFGQKAMITLEGMKRLTPSAFPAAAYLTLEDGENYETMKERIGEAFPNAVINDGANTIDSVFGGIMNIVYIICFFFLVATYIVVSFILYMIGKSRIIEQKKELGISKAIGYTTGQLVFKNIVSIIPLVVVGSLLGMLLTYLFTNPLLSGMFYTIGFGKFSYPHFFLQYLVVIIFLIIDALAVTIIFSLRIRKIEPVKMIRE